MKFNSHLAIQGTLILCQYLIPAFVPMSIDKQHAIALAIGALQGMLALGNHCAENSLISRSTNNEVGSN